jgi:hypothetical protein
MLTLNDMYGTVKEMLLMTVFSGPHSKLVIESHIPTDAAAELNTLENILQILCFLQNINDTKAPDA